jgi:DNA recombination protein RmuC
LGPIKEALAKLETGNQEIEKNREGAYQSLKTTLDNLQQQTQDLASASTSLSTALKGSSQARGNWGEISLKNIAEAAGMLQHCDFDIQMTLEAGVGGARADMLVTLPGGGMIPVDAKAPLTAFIKAQEAKDEDERKKALKQLTKDVKKHVDDLVQRDYAQYAERGVDFTVMYVPSEPVLAATFEAEPKLQEYAFSKRILITTPVTLLALLRTVAVYWRHEAIMDNASEIAENAQELYSRVTTFAEHLAAMGSNLRKTLESYNQSVGSFERRVVPAGKRLMELEITDGSKEIPSLPNLEDEDVRALSALPEPIQIK